MKRPVQFLGPAEAAGRLGVSAKALRLYEERGLLTPARNPAGWRSYGPDQMRRGGDIVALRALGLSLAQIAGVLEGGSEGLAPALAAHQALLEGRARQLADTIENVRGLRPNLDRGQTPTVEELVQLRDPAAERRVEFELPWPWGGERFTLHGIRPLNYIVGPLGSGKTRLASRLAEVLPSAVFLGLERVKDGRAAAQLQTDSGLRSRVQHAADWLVGDGATVSEALLTLLAGLEAEAPAILIVDMVEHGLDAATQQALAGYLRRRASDDRPLFLLTRSTVILDLESIGPGQCVILCPANHSPPTRVAPYVGAAGYEAVATCLATPEVRARTEGVIAWRPPQRDEFPSAMHP
ncbi:MAG: MerR family transcriptional regulator [Proteobacteria bacterium]|nr:MerR family transcriptional regulator [Pseudomonadota bacterium]